MQTNVDNIVASDYIDIDARIEGTEMIDEEEIIAAVQEALEEEEEIISNSISNMDALNSIQKIFNYLQHSSDIKTNASVISGMKDLQCQIQRKQIASLKQPPLETFYKN